MDPTAVMGKRYGAFAIDLVMAWAITIVIFLVLADSETAFFDPCGFDQSPTLCIYAGETVYFAEGGTAATIVLLAIGQWLALFWAVPAFTGGTLGKLMVGLRVIDGKTGELANAGKHLVRALFLAIDQFPFFLVGIITSSSSKGHRRVGDMVATTLVVDKASVGTPPVVAGLTTTAGTFTPAPPGAAVPPPTGAPIPPPTDVPPAQPPTATPVATEPDGVSAPKWDAARNAYIQWDPQLSAWMQFDEAARQWRPIT